MAAVIHSSPAPARWRQEGRGSRQPERESFVHEIVNGILANKRPEHGIDSLFTPLVALEFLECFAIAESQDHTEIEGWFPAGRITRQGPADARTIHAPGAGEGGTAPKQTMRRI